MRLYLRKNLWWVRYSFNGKRYHYSLRVCTEAEAKEEFDITELIIDLLIAQTYHLQYPLSEVNLGHPIEIGNGNVVKSSNVKQLGYALRQMLLINAMLSPSAKPDVSLTDTAVVMTVDTSAFLPALTEEEKALFNHFLKPMCSTRFYMD